MSSSFGSNMPKKHSGVVAWVRAFFGRDSEGSALVEMALSLPILLAIMTGIFSFSIALYQKLQLAEGVSTAGRVLAVDRGAVDPCLDATNALYAAAPGLAQNQIALVYTLKTEWPQRKVLPRSGCQWKPEYGGWQECANSGDVQRLHSERI